MSDRLPFVICTEDSGKQGVPTVTALVKRLAQRLTPDLATHKLDFCAPAGEPRSALGGAYWKSRTDPRRRALLRYLATQLAAGRWVVFHIDGDQAWATESGGRHQRDVDALFAELSRVMGGEGGHPRLLRLVPHYSVESWVYLNDRELHDLVARQAVPSEAVEWLTTRRGPTGGYDHVEQIKRDCPLKDRFNQMLAEANWPVREAADRSPSWAHAERSWAENLDLREALSTVRR